MQNGPQEGAVLLCVAVLLKRFYALSGMTL